MKEFLRSWKTNKEYFELIELMSSLSNVFSESSIPYLHYRVTENLFAKCFSAINLSRSDIAYDAQCRSFGVGIKTFQLDKKGESIEKIAEFNRLSSELRHLRGKSLAVRVAELRNQRITTADELCNINEKMYHIVGRRENEISLFNSPYLPIEIDQIHDVRMLKDDKGVVFSDGNDEYRFYYSKSVLLKRFELPQDRVVVPVKIIKDPYDLLKELIVKKEHIEMTSNLVAGKDFVILPLYSNQKGGYVPEKSGLNQWNASGRKRDPDELYISIPRKIQRNYPDFFPSKDFTFELQLPSGDILNAKVCQDGEKALMSYPNRALGKWLLRDIMKIPYNKLVTMRDLDILGFNSVIITKIKECQYAINVSNIQSYEEFDIQNNLI